MLPDPVNLMAAGLAMLLAGCLWWFRWFWIGAFTAAAATLLLRKTWADG